MNILAIIPARGGSERIPNKNLRDLHGKPLIGWTIEIAKKVPLINKVLVTTDSEQIRSVSTKYGAEAPFLRPSNLANNTLGIEPVLIHAIEWLRDNESYTPDVIVLLMPTNPLKTSADITEIINLFNKGGTDSVISVSKASGNNNPHWMLKKGEDDKISLFNGNSIKDIVTRSQDLPICYSRNDIAYVLKPSNLYQKPSNLYGDDIKLYVMDEFFNGDINTEEDWCIAKEKFLRNKKETK